MSIGERLRSWRKEKNLTTTQIHEATGISLGALSNYENDKREVGSDLLVQLNEKFNLNIVYILTGVKDDNRLTDEQEQILYYFNLCDQNDKRLVIDLLKRFTNNHDDYETHIRRT